VSITAAALFGAGCGQFLDTDAKSDSSALDAGSDVGDLNDKIVGGTSARPGEFPFFVHGFGCGASLVWPDVALTAAHCRGVFSDVLVGPTRYGSTAGGAQRNRVTKQVRHPRFNASTMENDFMMLKLQKSVPSSMATPIELASASDDPRDGEPLTVIGFGSTREGGRESDTLLKVVLDFIPHAECNQRYRGEIDEVSMFCAGVDGGGKDSCQGDSGGPIFDASGVQVGVVSWGIGCARKRFPGVYARVSSARDWIWQQICALSEQPPADCGK
jgi:trypsin